MINVTRLDLFQTPGLDPFDGVLRGFFRPVKLENKKESLIKIDVSEDDKSYTVYAEIPGVKKCDLHVSIEGNQVSINAETRQNKEVKEGGGCCIQSDTMERLCVASHLEVKSMRVHPVQSILMGSWS